MLRIGIGYDVHQLQSDRKLILGGIEIPYEKGLLGHSDADVLIHAIMDSLLGASSLGDIGQLFPDSSEEFRGISSLILLEKTFKVIASQNWKIENIDSVIIAEQPKISPWISEMKEKISSVLDISANQIGIKATTTEKLGFTGRKEGIAAQAVSLLSRKD